jgi:hypothetical protein
MDTNKQDTLLFMVKEKVGRGGVVRINQKLQTDFFECGFFYKPITKMVKVEKNDKV